MIKKLIYSLLLALLTTSGVFASEGWSYFYSVKMIFAYVNFIIFMGILVYLSNKYIKVYFQKREAFYREEITSIKEKFNEVTKQQTELESKMSNIDAEVENLKGGLVEEGKRVKDKMIKEAVILSQKIEQDIEKRIKSEFLERQRELRAKMLEVAIDISSEEISKNLGK